MLLIECINKYEYTKYEINQLNPEQLLNYILKPDTPHVNPFMSNLIDSLKLPQIINNLIFPFTAQNERKLKKNLMLAQANLAFSSCRFSKDNLNIYFVDPREETFGYNQIYNLQINKQDEIYSDCIVGYNMGLNFDRADKKTTKLLQESLELYRSKNHR